MDNNSKNEKSNRSHKYLWVTIAFVVLVIAALIILKSPAGKEGNGFQSVKYIDITYSHLTSKLPEGTPCYICGEPMPDYGNSGTLAVILLNEAHVIDLQLRPFNDPGMGSAEAGSVSMRTNDNYDGIKYRIESDPGRGVSRLELIMKPGYMLDESSLEGTLCQDCLSKVAKTFEQSYAEGEAKPETVPFCMMGTTTLEMYPLQLPESNFYIGDYLVEVETAGETKKISVYYVPMRDADGPEM